MTKGDVILIGQLAEQLQQHGVTEASVTSSDGQTVSLVLSPFHSSPTPSRDTDDDDELIDLDDERTSELLFGGERPTFSRQRSRRNEIERRELARSKPQE